MSQRLWIWAAGLFAALLVLTNTFYVVPQTHQALVRQFGKVVRAINVGSSGRPGLYIKAPFLEDVVTFDKRNIGATLVGNDPIVASDQQRLVVDAFTRWRIKDPLQFYQTLQSESRAEAQLQSIMNGTLRRVLGNAPSGEIISGQRAALMRTIAKDIQIEAKKYGITIVDVRIRQADLPPEVAERVFERMRTDRSKVAAQERAEGKEQATRIRAEAERERTVITATAREQAETTRGGGDAERAKIFAESFGRDPEFAAFYRSMRAYEAALPPGTAMVIPADGEFFKYLKDKDAR